MLIIHPKDTTTDSLCEIYKNIDCEIIRNGQYPKSLLKKKIQLHDKIVFLGHGTEQGLLRTPIDGSFLISSEFVHLLREKECVYIWCNADQFVNKYKLKGFCTGMIISEPEEAIYCSIPYVNDEIDISNKEFSMSIKPYIKLSKSEILKGFLKDYQSINSITEFNKNNVFIF